MKTEAKNEGILGSLFCLLLHHIGRLLPRHAGTCLLVKGRKKLNESNRLFRAIIAGFLAPMPESISGREQGACIDVFTFWKWFRLFLTLPILSRNAAFASISTLLAFKAAIDVLIQLHYASYFVIAVVTSTTTLDLTQPR